MLFQTPRPSKAVRADLAELDRLRERLGSRVGTHTPWLGELRRHARASTAESSISIEGYTAPATDPEHRLALDCYARAMDHVGAMAADPNFVWSERAILDLHFDACWFQRGRSPGLYRTGPISVTGPLGGPPAYVGPDPEIAPELMAEAVAWLGDDDAHPAIRAAMAHLHIVSIHPFRDGNGRIARIVQSLVLALGGDLVPEFASIEEYLGRRTADYDAVLQQVQGGSYRPTRDASPWIRFCVEAHLDQARLRLAQIDDAGRRWRALEQIVEDRGWPDRLAIALEQSLFAGVDRASYIEEADIAAPTASNDLRRLVDADLVVRRGQGRSTRYVASDDLRRRVSRVSAPAPAARCGSTTRRPACSRADRSRGRRGAAARTSRTSSASRGRERATCTT